jgi:Domain of unknown function (DUF4387)
LYWDLSPRSWLTVPRRKPIPRGQDPGIVRTAYTYERVRDAGLINSQRFAKTYRLTPEVVTVINHDAASAIKVTIPRPTISGDTNRA